MRERKCGGSVGWAIEVNISPLIHLGQWTFPFLFPLWDSNRMFFYPPYGIQLGSFANAHFANNLFILLLIHLILLCKYGLKNTDKK